MDQENQMNYNNEPIADQKEPTYPDTSMTEEKNWNQQNGTGQPVKAPQSTLALVSLVMGILGIVTSCCIYGGIIFGSLGIMFALLSKTEARFEGYAKAGLITSIISLVIISILFFILLVLQAAGKFYGGGMF
jgi:hypothetical protein